MRTGEPVLLPEIPDALLVASMPDPEQLRLTRALGLESAIIAPIHATTPARGTPRVLGALTLVSAESRRRYTPRDVERAEELARRLALVIERARLTADLDRERQLLAEQARELAQQNEALQQQAVELEMQAAQLQEQAAELEAQSEDLQLSNLALGASEARFRSLFESMTQGVVYYDAAGRIVDANPAAAELFGSAREAMTGRDGPDVGWRFTDAQGAPLAHEAMPHLRALRTGRMVLGERLGLVHEPSGVQRWLSVDAVPETHGDELAAFHAYALLSDVTAQVHAERERQRLMDAEREARRQMMLVFEQAPVAICVLRGPTHVYELANQSYRALLPGRELVGRPVREALADLDPSILVRLDRAYTSGEPFVGVELPLRYDRERNGVLGDAYFNLVYQPLRDADGAVVGLVTVATDVTDQVLARRASESARESAEEANMAKSQFLRTVSHELRTPLNAIAGYADLVLMELRGPITDEQRLDLERIKRASQHLLGLINDILSFAKLEAGQVEFTFADVELSSVLGEVEGLLAPQMTAKGLRCAFAACAPGLRVRADAERLRQILINLLGNALKFTPSGGELHVDCASEADAVVIRVRDTGVGIPTEALERIFDPFVQVGRDLRAPSDGVGLGLAISRDLARRMGGELTAESVVGVGSTFTVRLPRADAVADR